MEDIINLPSGIQEHESRRGALLRSMQRHKKALDLLARHWSNIFGSFPAPSERGRPAGKSTHPASRRSRGSYRGLGSGIKRALEDWPDIEFTDDREGCLFTATVHRQEGGGSEKGSPKIIEIIRQSPAITIPEIAQHVGVTDRAIKKQIEKLKIQGRIRRISPARGGHPEVIE